MRSLYAFDFDGTLAPISPDPASASASATTLDLIRALAGLAPVLVVSGRSVRDLKRRIAIKGIHLIGNHGLEGVLSRKKSVDTARASRSKWIRQLASF
ncbi:MAG: hypothetical protein HUU37_08155, partial [Bdellovibrionales bacterium]|nr:hypothetical protein [Bdellovibrionales bacterium]